MSRIILIISFLLLSMLLSGQTLMSINGKDMVCFSPEEYQAFQEKTKQIMEETTKQAVKKATVPLLAEIEALNYEKLTWNLNYKKLYDSYESLGVCNLVLFCTTGTELVLLILSWVLPRS